MKRKLYILNTVALIIILSAGLMSIYFLKGNLSYQFAAGIVTAISYMFWGILYHSIKGDLHKKIIVEYILVSLLGIVLIYIVLIA